MQSSHQGFPALATRRMAGSLSEKSYGCTRRRTAQVATVLFALLHQSEDVPRRRKPKLLSVILMGPAALDRRIEPSSVHLLFMWRLPDRQSQSEKVKFPALFRRGEFNFGLLIDRLPRYPKDVAAANRLHNRTVWKPSFAIFPALNLLRCATV